MRLNRLLIVTAATCSLTACSQRHGTAPQTAPSHTAEQWDAHSDPKIFGLKPLRFEELDGPQARKGSLPRKPWTDSYWPYYKKNVAWRYASPGSDFTSFDAQAADAVGNPANPALSPAEKYDIIFDNGFQVTNQSWAAYTEYATKYGDPNNWSWMGICNGWAPAALNEAAPGHAVVAQSAGREVLFFEGDIRGLLSKAYDLNATQDGYKMVGTRCDVDEGMIPRDANGRPVDGKATATGEMFTILQDYSLSLGALQVTRDPLSPNPYWLMAKQPIDKLAGQAWVYVYKTRDDVAADAQAHTVGKRATNQTQILVEFYKGCRDVNPASMHLALVQSLSDAAPAKGGFVVEISRSKQVWNHPIWGYSTDIGRPTAVATEPPAKRIFRSPGAAFTAPVTTRLIYVGGVEPVVNYHLDADEQIDWAQVRSGQGPYAMIDLRYTLEFDSSGYVIGGEWTESPDFQIGALDFFWKAFGPLTDTNKDGNPSILKYSNVKKLLDCSQGEPDATVGVDVNGSHADVAVVHCAL